MECLVRRVRWTTSACQYIYQTDHAVYIQPSSQAAIQNNTRCALYMVYLYEGCDVILRHLTQCEGILCVSPVLLLPHTPHRPHTPEKKNGEKQIVSTPRGRVRRNSVCGIKIPGRPHPHVESLEAMTRRGSMYCCRMAWHDGSVWRLFLLLAVQHTKYCPCPLFILERYKLLLFRGAIVILVIIGPTLPAIS